MRDKNKDILARLIAELPQYQAPAEVWEQIDKSLSLPPSAAWNQLPEYQPPDSVWDQIESGLSRKQAAPSARLLPLRRMLPWATGIAATLAGLFWLFQPFQSVGSTGEGVVSISYSREIVDASLLQRDWEQDENAFEMINRLCAGSAFTCNNPDMQSLQAELDELTEAKISLEEALGKFGTDVDLIGQLTEIERQRTALLKQILDYFI